MEQEEGVSEMIKWTEDLTDAQLKMLMASGIDGLGVEVRGASWRTAGKLVGMGLGSVEGGAPNGSGMPGLFFANDEGVRILREFEPEEDEEGAFDEAFIAATTQCAGCRASEVCTCHSPAPPRKPSALSPLLLRDLNDAADLANLIQGPQSNLAKRLRGHIGQLRKAPANHRRRSE